MVKTFEFADFIMTVDLDCIAGVKTRVKDSERAHLGWNVWLVYSTGNEVFLCSQPTKERAVGLMNEIMADKKKSDRRREMDRYRDKDRDRIRNL